MDDLLLLFNKIKNGRPCFHVTVLSTQMVPQTVPVVLEEIHAVPATARVPGSSFCGGKGPRINVFARLVSSFWR